MGVTRNPLEFGLLSQNRSDSLVDYFATINSQFGYGFTDRFGVFVDVPFNIYSQVESIQTAVTTKDVSLGDVRILLPFSILSSNRENQKTGVALVPFVTLPTGAEVDFFGNESLWKGVSTLGGKLALDAYWGTRHYIAFNAGVRFREDVNVVNSLILDHEILSGFGYVWTMSPKKQWDLLVDAYGSTTFRKSFREEQSSPIDMTLAARKSWNGVAWIFGGGIGFNNGYGSPDWRAFTGVAFSPRKKAVPAPVVEQKPVAQQPEVKKPIFIVQVVDEKNQTLPAKITLIDANGKTAIIHPATPNVVETGTYQMKVESVGYAPLTKDIVLVNGDQKTETVTLALVKKQKIDLKGKVNFESGKATLLPGSYGILNDVVKTLNAHPEIQKVNIEAHTDSQGDENLNQKLSAARASAVVEYLVGKGISRSKLVSKGFGESLPIADNKTSDGRAQNRRVEFFITE